MNPNLDPPFRADHVGSLLRPKSLTAGFRRHRAGEISGEEYGVIQDNAIKEVIALQERVGLHSITDGEFRRASYWSAFVERVQGLEVREALFTFHDEEGHEQGFTAPHVAARLRRNRPIAEDEYLFVRDNTSQTPKITLPSPPSMHFWRLGKGIDPAVYPDYHACFTDLATVYREEIAALAELGATYIQLDDVPIPMLCDPAVQDRVRDAGMDPATLMQDYLQLCNDCLKDKPDKVTVAMHMCRGNYKGRFLSEGGYETFAEAFFNTLEVDAYFLEYDSPRSGDFEPLRFVPAEQDCSAGSGIEQKCNHGRGGRAAQAYRHGIEVHSPRTALLESAVWFCQHRGR